MGWNGALCSTAFFQIVLKLLSSKHFFQNCIRTFEIFEEALPLDKTVLSCIAFAATEVGNTEVAMKCFERMRSSTSCELTVKDYVNFFRVFAKRSAHQGRSRSSGAS